MATLALPLVASLPKPQNTRASFFFSGRRKGNGLSRTLLARRELNFAAAASSSSAVGNAAVALGTKVEDEKESVLTFQQAIQRLQVGAGTMNPLTFLRVLGPEPWNVAYVEPSIRPDDSRYGENPNRLQRHTQFQVILKPDPGNSQDLFIGSLSALGIDVNQHDIRFVEDNWESPVLGAWGLGWEVWMDGMEITQFTYFQQAGSLQLQPVSVEITYGLERIIMSLQGVDHFKKIQYADGITYGELFLENEKEMSAYYLEHASVHNLQKHFDFFEDEAHSLLKSGLPIPAYDQLLKTSHVFNILDSRGFVGVTERARYFGRMRRESLGHPLGVATDHDNFTCPKGLLEAAAKKVCGDPRPFVLEIGTEELPPHDVVSASQQLKDLITQLLEKQRLRHNGVEVFGTPRRVVVTVDGLHTKQVGSEVEVRGPPTSKAYDSQGRPTKAVEGFCRRYGLALESLYAKVDGKTEYVYALVMESARLALEVMFSRPIRWILALHGDVVIPFIFAGILSGKQSSGLRNTLLAIVEVDRAESYSDIMRYAGVSVKMEERKNNILECSKALAKDVNCHILVEEALLDEVVNLVEAPVPVLGKFSESFLVLPKDLLTMVMQKHQRYFALTDEDGKLQPYFIAVANGAIDENVVRRGNEAVLRARYEDAKFFYDLDTRKKFSEFRNQLKGILFHEKLGTMLDKMTRIECLVTNLTVALKVDTKELETIQKAASLAMSDLATAVVTEFTSLSGIMARHYALRDGYSVQIAEALFEIMLPRFAGDILPGTDAGLVLAIADRLDSLIGLFAAGCQPSSTSDPFGLRRTSYALVQMLVEKDKNLDLRYALQLAAEVQPIKADSGVINDAHQFVARRLEQFLIDKDLSPEVVRAVLAERANWPCSAAKSAHKMENLMKGELLPKVVEAYSRPTRIVRGKDVESDLQVDEAVFETDQEKALWNSFLSIQSKIHPDIEVDDFTEISSQLIQPLEEFFDNVFVMVEDERIRKNRLALLKKIADLPKGIVDLSLLPGF
ncbi:unnamed protein product [Rhodiola kirilowii]